MATGKETVDDSVGVDKRQKKARVVLERIQMKEGTARNDCLCG